MIFASQSQSELTLGVFRVKTYQVSHKNHRSAPCHDVEICKAAVRKGTDTCYGEDAPSIFSSSSPPKQFFEVTEKKVTR